MIRKRWVQTIGLIVLLAGITYVLASLYLPSPRRLIFGVDKRSGRVRVVGNNVAFLPPHQYYRLLFDRREGFAQSDGFIRIESQDKIPVTVDYRLRFSVEGERIPDVGTLIRQGWSDWIGRRVAEAVYAVAQHVPIEELLAPNSRFNTERDPLRRTVAAYLARSGLKVTAFEIARIEADRDALLKIKRAELRRGARGAAGRVAIFAIDGADWDLISELSNDGRIPNLRALARGGVTASVQTIQPTVSPMLWTTVATGLPPDRHGVLDFTDPRRRTPVDASARRAPAIWEIADAFGRHAMAVNYWTAWPPTSPESFVYDVAMVPETRAIHPAKYQERAQRLAVPVQNIGYDQVRRFLTVTGEEFQQSVQANDPRDPVNAFRNVLAKTWSDHRVAINLYTEQQPLLLMMSYSGTDSVNHLFAPFHPPLREGVSAGGYRRYWAAVANYYSEVDRLIGEWMNVLPVDTTVIVMSAHGFKWGQNRPRAIPTGTAALSDHRNPGIFIAYGNHVQKSAGNRTITLYDIVPTVLAILGLPQSSEMPGQVASWALAGITPVDSVRVVSYGEFLNPRPMPSAVQAEPKQYQAALQAIGHVTDPSSRSGEQTVEGDAGAQPVQIPPEQWGRYAYLNNTGIELRKQGKVREAVEAFAQAVQMNPQRPAARLNLAMALIERQQFTAADEQFLAAVAAGLPNAEQWFVDFAALYRERDMATRAIALLYKGKQLFPQSALIAANLGSALVAMNRTSEGLPELERALGLQPSLTLALNNLGSHFAKKNDYGRALDFWNRSLAIDPRQPKVRIAAESARSRL